MRRLRRWGRWRWAAAGVVCVCAWVGFRWFDQRIQFVTEGLYRSPQLNAERLRRGIDDLGLRSVLSLRGTGGGGQWFRREIEVCRSTGVRHERVTFSIDEPVPRPAALRYVEVLEELDQPVLVHCNRGIDRTGWAAGAALLLEGRPLEEALVELSPARGHFCLKRRCPQHQFFDAYRRFLSETGRAATGAEFRHWIEDRYCPESWNCELRFEATPGSRVTVGEPVRVEVEGRNRGLRPWASENRAVIRLGARRIGPLTDLPVDPIGLFLDRSTEVRDIARSPTDLEGIPGRAFHTDLVFQAPGTPGRYLVQVDLVEEHRHWFSEMGWPGLIMVLEVVPSKSSSDNSTPGADHSR